MTAFLVGLAVGAAMGWLAHRFKPRRRIKALVPPALQPQERANKYGHPRAPVPALKDRLPDAPPGHAWEIRVQHDDKGTPFLHLALLSIATGKPVEEKKTNLTNRRPGSTWAAEYRSYSLIKGSIFNNDLLGPVVDWASQMADKYANANATGDYAIGDAS